MEDWQKYKIYKWFHIPLCKIGIHSWIESIEYSGPGQTYCQYCFKYQR